MPIFKVNVKWQKEKYSDLECNTDESPDVFKALLFSLTGVPLERQKIMMPGKILDNNYDGIKLRNGANIMLMGTAEQIDVVTDMKNLPDSKIISEDKFVLPHGIVNLGNTCYMNATVQLLYSCPELVQALSVMSISSNPSPDNQMSLNVNLKLLFDSMGKAEKPVIPAFFLATLHTAYPQFATRESGASTKSPAAMAASAAMGGSDLISSMANIAAVGSSGGGFQQQDANECWNLLVRALQKAITDTRAIQSSKANLSGCFGTTGGWNPIDRFMTGHLECKLKCTESEEEPITMSTDTFTQLSCFINKDVKYLHTGIRNGLEGELTKYSSVLGRDAAYKKESLISRIPGYLSIQFVRFFYKEKEQINAKILKDIKFPLSLDLYEFCTPNLQAKLLPMRERIRAEEDRLANEGPKREKGAKKIEDEPVLPESELEPYWLEDDLGSNNTGFYDLQGVLTHQGRSSNLGHYVSWVKRKNKWIKFDDDTVSEVTADDILRLSGGGDWHCAYVLLYAPRRVPKSTPKPQDKAGAAAAATANNASVTVGTVSPSTKSGGNDAGANGTSTNAEEKMSVDGGDV